MGRPLQQLATRTSVTYLGVKLHEWSWCTVTVLTEGQASLVACVLTLDWHSDSTLNLAQLAGGQHGLCTHSTYTVYIVEDRAFSVNFNVRSEIKLYHM